MKAYSFMYLIGFIGLCYCTSVVSSFRFNFGKIRDGLNVAVRGRPKLLGPLIQMVADSNNTKEKITSNGNGKSNLLKILDEYSILLEKYPYVTKIISSGLIGALGDTLIQYWMDWGNAFNFDYRRLTVFTTVAAFYIAPVINVWFNWLSRLPFPSSYSNFRKAFIMMVLDQTFAAVVVTAGFFYAFELAQVLIPPYSIASKSFLVVGYDSTVRNLWKTLVANWYCWPVINFLNFLVVPLKYR